MGKSRWGKSKSKAVGGVVEEDSNYPPPTPIPVDAEGFARAFPVSNGEEARAFFEEWGFVVFCDVLCADECLATVSEIWGSLEEGHPGLDRSDIETYDCLKLAHGLAPTTPQYTSQVAATVS